jgi:hypothetical protein
MRDILEQIAAGLGFAAFVAAFAFFALFVF